MFWSIISCGIYSFIHARNLWKNFWTNIDMILDFKHDACEINVFYYLRQSTNKFPAMQLCSFLMRVYFYITLIRMVVRSLRWLINSSNFAWNSANMRSMFSTWCVRLSKNALQVELNFFGITNVSRVSVKKKQEFLKATTFREKCKKLNSFTSILTEKSISKNWSQC